MADIRFKISGNTNPFIAKLWNSGCTALLQQKSIDYSGTCVIFGGLDANTYYNVSINDKIDTIYSKQFLTPAPITPSILPTKYVCLIGTLYNSSDYVQQISSPKELFISPILSTGECVDVKLRINTTNYSNTQNSITLYCGGVALSPVYSNSGQQYKTINIKPNDSICYTMTTYATSSPGVQFSGTSNIEIIGTTGHNITSLISSTYYSKSTCLSISNTGSISANQTIFVLSPSSISYSLPIIITSTQMWEIDVTTVPSWINYAFVDGNSGDSPDLFVQANDTPNLRNAMVKIWLKNNHNIFVVINITI
jgi:hypothetical protein